MAKMLFIDIETMAALGYFFQAYQPIIGVDQIVKPPRMIMATYRWAGEKKVHCVDEFNDGRIEMLTKIRDLLDEADIVVHYNGQRFDTPWIKGELQLEGIDPPSPFQQIDLYRHFKANARFISGKLDWAALQLLDDRKVTHAGFTLWRRCDEGEVKAWQEMKRYALKDTALLEPIYEIVKPWIRNHPNIALIDGLVWACPKCGSEDLQKRGLKATGASVFQQYRCSNCGGWSYDKSRVATTTMRNSD